MKRIKIPYQIKGENFELYAEPMDMNHRMYSVERELMDPHPLLIERQAENKWVVKSQDNWALSDDEVSKLGQTLDKVYPDQPQQ